MNLVVLVGRVSFKNELENDNQLRFQLAVKRNYKNDEGEYDTDFFSISSWGGLAKTINEYVNVGDTISVTGKLQTWNKELENGSGMTVISITADKFEFISSKKKENENK